MCEYSGRLIAWLDQELPDEEATNVEWHIGQCAECRKAVSAYEEVSGAFLACYEAGIAARPKRAPWPLAAVAGGVAAAILLTAVLARPRPEQAPAPPPAVHAPSIAFEKTPAFEKRSERMVAVRTRRAPARPPAFTPWIAVEPMVEVALPADALFPPGAVPPGFSFIADVRP